MNQLFLFLLLTLLFSSCKTKPTEDEIKSLVTGVIKTKVELLDFNIIKCDKQKEGEGENYAVTFTSKYKILDSLTDHWYGDTYEIEVDNFQMTKTYSGTWWTEKKEFKIKRVTLGNEAKFINQKFNGLINNEIPVTLIISNTTQNDFSGNIQYANQTHEVNGSITNNGLTFWDVKKKDLVSNGKYIIRANQVILTKAGKLFTGKTISEDGISTPFEMKRLD